MSETAERPYVHHSHGCLDAWHHVPEGFDFFYAPDTLLFSDGLLRGPLSYHRTSVVAEAEDFRAFYCNVGLRMRELAGEQGDFITVRTNDGCYLLIVRGLDAKARTVLHLI